jgi:2-polyprenyl-3-methyl-5-hydroxy-6-metoxy-1,4-benzoquinol methylase
LRFAFGSDNVLLRIGKDWLARVWVALGRSFFRGKSFQGVWEDRIATLFQLDIDFSGASILDVGCNMGVVGLEICRHKPLKYHGIEKMVVHSFVAECVFRGVDIENRIDRIDIGSKKQRDHTLDDQYDIVLYLAVHHHLKRQVGEEAAKDVMVDLFNRCKSRFVYHGTFPQEAIDIGQSLGWKLVKSIPQGKLNPVCYFVRA